MVFIPVATLGVRSATPLGKISTKSNICDISEAATVKVFGNDSAGFSEVAEYLDNFCRYYNAMTPNSYGNGFVSTKSSTVEMLNI